jgi:hypothetical protein
MSKKWQRFAWRIRASRLFTCEWCGADHNRFEQREWLHVHHVVKWKVSVELRFVESNLLVLCPRCHNLAEKMPPETQRWLTAEFESKGFNLKLMPSYDRYNTNSSSGGDKAPLPEGAYTSNPKTKDKAGSSLHIIKKLEPKTLQSGSTRHSFLVGSEDTHGTAFLKVDLQDYFLTPEACALAFSKKSKDNSSPFQLDPEDQTELDAEAVAACQQRISEDAANKVAAANTPEEAVADATEKAIRNTLTQIQINVGTIFRLQDWAGLKRDPQGDLGALDQTVFEGSVKASSLPGGAPEVSVYSLPKGKKVQQSSATAFSAQQ